jgi:hypothetical protein
VRANLTSPPRVQTFVFIDEREDSINDDVFYAGMGRRGTDAHWIFHVTPTGFFLEPK